MRKQPRIAAAIAAFLLSSGMVAADIVATAEPAAAASPRRKARKAKAQRRRPPAPPTAENFARLRDCESRGNYAINTGNGYYGAYQFSLRTWRGIGYTGYPHQASAATQDEAARKLQAQSGWGQWPACSRKLGLR